MKTIQKQFDQLIELSRMFINKAEAVHQTEETRVDYDKHVGVYLGKYNYRAVYLIRDGYDHRYKITFYHHNENDEFIEFTYIKRDKPLSDLSDDIKLIMSTVDNINENMNKVFDVIKKERIEKIDKLKKEISKLESLAS